MTAGEGIDLHQQDQTHHRRVKRRADPGAVRQHQAALQLGDLIGGNRRSCQAAEAGGHAIDLAVLAHDGGDGFGGRVDGGPGRRRHSDLARPAPERMEIAESEASGRQVKQGIVGHGGGTSCLYNPMQTLTMGGGGGQMTSHTKGHWVRRDFRNRLLVGRKHITVRPTHPGGLMFPSDLLCLVERGLGTGGR